jgi:hypothetical protein
MAQIHTAYKAWTGNSTAAYTPGQVLVPAGSVVEPNFFVSAPAPTLAFYLPFITDFILKSGFFIFFFF